MTTIRVCVITTVITVVCGYIVAYTMAQVGERQAPG